MYFLNILRNPNPHLLWNRVIRGTIRFTSAGLGKVLLHLALVFGKTQTRPLTILVVPYCLPVNCLSINGCNWVIPRLKLISQGIINLNLNQPAYPFVRFKSRGKNKNKKDDESSSDESDDEDDCFLEKGENFRDVKVQVSSLRIDAVLKSGLGLAKNKSEELFYGGKLRINKEKCKKKSLSLMEGDTIDVLKSGDGTDGDVEISRVVLRKIISVNESSGAVMIILRKYPKLTSKTYNDIDAVIYHPHISDVNRR